MKTAANSYDVIVVGSGMGGLTCASILAKMQNKRVLVLERHFKLGGFTHIFRRESKYDWDVGVHYVGEMQHGTMPRAVMDFITAGQLKWHRMPEVYDVFRYPDITFQARAGMNNLKQDLKKEFPEQSSALDRYFKDVRKASGWNFRNMLARLSPIWLKPLTALLRFPGRRIALQTTQTYLDKHFTDQRLKALLVSQWGDYGVPPARSAFCVHAMIAGHYFDGGYYPVGGSGRIAESIKPVVESSGGAMLVNHDVREVIVENGRAVGVKSLFKKGDTFVEKDFYADVIISNIGAALTYNKLLPGTIGHKEREQINVFPDGCTCVTLYIGLKESPEKIDISGENYWLYNGYDHDAIYSDRNGLLEGRVNGSYVSFPSLKNPAAKHHTAEIIAFSDYEAFAQWRDKAWKNRGEAYETLKQNISQALLDFVDGHLPGFMDLVAYHELATPLSSESMTFHRKGAIYGIPAIPERMRAPWISPLTPVKNLYMTGTDAGAHGIVGAMMSAVVTSGLVIGMPMGLLKIFRTAQMFSKANTDS